MFLKTIEEYYRKFHLLNVVSDIAFTFWTSSDAVAYKEGKLMDIQKNYHEFTSQMDKMTKELDKFNNQAKELEERLLSENRNITNFCHNPPTRGYGLYRARGPLKNKSCEYGTEAFVAKFGENEKELAYQYCTKLERIEGVSLERHL